MVTLNRRAIILFSVGEILLFTSFELGLNSAGLWAADLLRHTSHLRCSIYIPETSTILCTQQSLWVNFVERFFCFNQCFVTKNNRMLQEIYISQNFWLFCYIRMYSKLFVPFLVSSPQFVSTYLPLKFVQSFCRTLVWLLFVHIYRLSKLKELLRWHSSGSKL